MSQKKKIKIVKTKEGVILKERVGVGSWRWWANVGGIFTPTVWKTKKEAKAWITEKYKDFTIVFKK